MPTKERGLLRNILASNAASGQPLFIIAALTPPPCRDLGMEGRQAASVSPPSSQPWPSAHTRLTTRTPQLLALHVQVPPPSKKATSSTKPSGIHLRRAAFSLPEHIALTSFPQGQKTFSTHESGYLYTGGSLVLD